MKPVIYINSTQATDIVSALKKLPGMGAHFTNGTYAFSAELIIPTTLAGFKHVVDKQPLLPLVIAVNSDISMEKLRKSDFEHQHIRAEKVAEPLAKTFPDNQVIIVYYDEETPYDLYKSLHAHGLTRTLHKWGFGTSPQAPKIEGAEYFEMVYGLPLPNDIKPVCYDDTPIADKPQNIIVADVRSTLITKEGVLFDLPQELEQYVDPQYFDLLVSSRP